MKGHILSLLLLQDEQSLVEHMKGLLKEDPQMSVVKYRPYLSALFDDSKAKDFVEKKLFKYLHYNFQHLPMYARPDMV